MGRSPQPVYRCPHCLSIKPQHQHLGSECPSCFQPLPQDLQPAYLVTDPHPFRRSKAFAAQGMGLSVKLLAGLVLGLCVVPALLPSQFQAPDAKDVSSLVRRG